MSKRLIIILALAFVVGIAFAAYAEVQNVKVSGDLLVRGVARNSYLLTDFGEKERAMLSAVRVRIDADLTDNVSTTVRLLNERVWGSENTSVGAATDNADIDLDLAYVTLKEFLYLPLTMVVGRQELRYGSALIIGDPDTNATAVVDSNLPAASSTVSSETFGLRDLSVRKAFDAVKAILNYDPLVIDLVYGKIEENTISRADDVNLMGINAAYALTKDLTTEGYLWSRDRQWGSTALATANLPGHGERLNVLGARTVYAGIENLTLGLEGAWQFGDHLASIGAAGLYPDDIRTQATAYKSKVNAYAIQFTSNYVIPRMKKYSPAVNFGYTRLSGDKDRSISDNYTGWDPMFEDQAGGTIFNRIVAFSNAQLFNLGGSMKPMDDVTVKLDWYNIRLLQTYNTHTGDVTRNLSGVGTDSVTTIKGDKSHLADEVDLNLIYDYTEDVQIGLNAGMYIPGAVYDKVNKKTATQLIGSMKVTF